TQVGSSGNGQSPQLPLQNQTPRPVVQPPRQTYSPATVATALTAAIDIVSARMLGLLAVIGAIFMFGHATIDPMPWRTYTVGLYAGVVVWPLVYLYLRKE